MEISQNEYTKIAKIETYAVPYVRMHEDVTKLSATEFVEKVIAACDELAHAKEFKDMPIIQDVQQYASNEDIMNFRLDFYAKNYVQAHYPCAKLTAKQFADYVKDAGIEICRVYYKEEEKK